MFDRVFISRENNEEASWSGIGQNVKNGDYLLSPSFDSLTEAVKWWKDRGEHFILVRFDDTEYVWAGEGRPPIDEGRDNEFRILDDVLINQANRGESGDGASNVLDDEEARTAIGEDVRRHREASGLSLQEVANRMNVDEEWLSEIERGSREDVDLNTLLRFVGATSNSWPNAKPSEIKRAGWVKSGPLSLGMAIKIFEES